MPNGWWFNWAKHGNKGKGKPRVVEKAYLLPVYCVCLLSLMDVQKQFLCPQAAKDQVALPR
jgi:hypothetical protein